MKEVTREEYITFFRGNLNMKPISSFSDPDGIIPFGYGVPAMDTDWGYEPDKPLARCEMRKENRDVSHWEYTYYLAQ